LWASESFVDFSHGDWQLTKNGKITVYVSPSDERGVMKAAKNLCRDIFNVSGITPLFVDNESEAAIVIGTAGKSAAVKSLGDKLRGKYEMFYVKAENNRLTIAGSDRRGTIYGIYELSRQIGVSPWYYWADVSVNSHSQIFIKNGLYTDGEPAVKWRGIFLNDEAPCLTSWVKNTFNTDFGGHEFYDRVFELILRLKGNMLWPAMWNWAFYGDDSENLKTADESGVIIGTSHHEPMARNHQEYARRRAEIGPWNYAKNQKNLDEFFREGIDRMKNTDDIVTIGMRGDGDEAMSADADTKLLEKIIANQRKIIAKTTGRPADKTPQVWALYKEVQDYYDAGLRVPDDVTILISDDNWGNIRRIPDHTRKGGWGIYYHVDYVGAPRNSKWINVTQTQQMFEQLSLAYDFGIEKLWILNVGDLKPMEYPITLFMDMAWKPKEYNLQNVTNHTERFFEDVLGKQFAKDAAKIYNQNCQYMARVTPEMLDSYTYNIETGEFKKVADEYARLEAEALRLYIRLPENAKDAYFQTLLFPVQAASNLNDMYYAQAMNRYCAERNNPDANYWASRVSEDFKRDSLLCAQYNFDIAGGKWKGMMTQKHIGYKIWNDNFPHDMLPETKTVSEGQGGYIFSHSDGFVSMEAEHFYSAKADGGLKWDVYPYYGRTRSAVALTPYTKPVGNSSLTYRFSLPENFADSVKVHVVVKSTLDFQNRGGHEYIVSLDGGESKTVNFNATLLDKQPYMYSVFYPAVARRVVEKVVGFKVKKSDVHSLTITPKHPGIVFEKIVVDFGGYKNEYLFGDESEVKR
jgi:hypothetical protein